MRILSRIRNNANFRQIESRVQRANRIFLFRSGGLAQGLMREQIDFSFDSATPGSPPNQHSRGRNTGLKVIRFGVMLSELTVIIGSIAFPSRGLSSAPVPNVLNFGGRARRSRQGPWFRVRRFPYVEPTARIIAPRLRTIWVQSFQRRRR